ncbi:MAG: Tol-Pal system beta propeller repeat protein TolB [Tagaea sp.]|nr:Tol-Pal system beta propeller repeat protein TolB [Tagaea sp.]
MIRSLPTLKRRSLIAGAAAAFALPGVARAQVRIDITRGRVDPLPTAVSPFFGEGADANTGREIAQVIAGNLERSGLFRPIDARAYTNTPAQLRAAAPQFGTWRQINSAILIHGNVEAQRDGRLRVEFRLWDVFAEAQMEGRVYTTVPANWRRIAHIISDAVYKRVTGEDGYFDTRVVYVSESGPAQRRVKRLALMDQDGANHRFLTDGRELVLTPRFSPTAQEITYLAYVQAGNNPNVLRPRVYLYNIDTGQREVVGDFPGMTFAPRFSPDGNRVIMSMAQGGNTDIHAMDLRTRQQQRVTNHPSINTSPSFAPDGRAIVFNSDRGGTQQLYTMTAGGENVQRISFGTGRYSTPVWSPRGDLIAFTKQTEGEFFIGVMRPDGQGERLLTRAFLVEGPTWAPNGRVLMYFRQGASDARGQGGNPRLYSIDLTGYNEREILTPADGSDPAWSPLLP